MHRFCPAATLTPLRFPIPARPNLKRQIAAIFEFAGAMTLGRVVTGTISGGIASSDAFKKDPDIFMYGMLSALTAATIWLYYATYMEWPVSTTHSISASARPAHVPAGAAQCCAPHLRAARVRRGRKELQSAALCDFSLY